MTIMIILVKFEINFETNGNVYGQSEGSFVRY